MGVSGSEVVSDKTNSATLISEVIKWGLVGLVGLMVSGLVLVMTWVFRDGVRG